MIGVDTNVLLRHLLDDDPEQSRAAHDFFGDRSAVDPAFVSLVTLIETAWVLHRAKGIALARLASVVRSLLLAEEIVLQAPDIVRRALRDTEEAQSDFADAVIAHLGVDTGCDFTVTLDRHAGELPGMRLLGV